MRTIVLVMLRTPVAQGIINKLNFNPNIRLLHESDYSNAHNTIRENNADIALIEIAETGEFNANYCLALCKGIRDLNCKLLLLCPEQDETSVAIAVDAKQKELIEDFVFYDASTDYLSSKLMAI